MTRDLLRLVLAFNVIRWVTTLSVKGESWKKEVVVVCGRRGRSVAKGRDHDRRLAPFERLSPGIDVVLIHPSRSFKALSIDPVSSISVVLSLIIISIRRVGCAS